MVRKFLDVSTAHIPPALRERNLALDDRCVTRHEYGWWMWVPDDPFESSESQPEPTPPELLEVQLHARRLGCDYVNFDADGELDPALPVFDEE